MCIVLIDIFVNLKPPNVALITNIENTIAHYNEVKF